MIVFGRSSSGLTTALVTIIITLLLPTDDDDDGLFGGGSGSIVLPLMLHHQHRIAEVLLTLRRLRGLQRHLRLCAMDGRGKNEIRFQESRRKLTVN